MKMLNKATDMAGEVMNRSATTVLDSATARRSVKRECAACPRRGESPWCLLDRKTLNHLNGGKECRPYLAGQTIFEQGTPCQGIFCIVSGTVAVRQNAADGGSVIIRLACEGDLLGYRTYFSEGPYPDSAEALTSALICFISRPVIQDILERHPAISAHFLRRMAADQGDIQDKFLQSSNCSVRDRLLCLLEALRGRYGASRVDGSVEIALPVARKDLAAMIGASTESVVRAMRTLEEEGVAVFEGRRVIVPTAGALCGDIIA